jgi:diguanylate cyclase (GGDEF)-like protein/PAS domain S-box-containing protein
MVIKQSDWRGAAVGCVIAVAIMALAYQLPPTPLFSERSANLLVTHLALEMFSVAVSAMVVVIAFHSLDEIHRPSANILVFAFTAIACVDFVHALAIDGMPDFLSPSSTPKAIFYWLVARSLELLAVLLILFRINLPGGRWHWLWLGVAASFGVTYLGSFQLHLMPTTFVEGQGVTPFKARLEYALCIGNLLLASALFVQAHRRQSAKLLQLGLASFILGVGEFAFAHYTSQTDLINVLGHSYKVVAYAFIFRAIFLNGLNEPYCKLKESEDRLLIKEEEYQTLTNNLPVGIARFDSALRYKYVSPQIEQNLNMPAHELLGLTLDQVLPDNLVRDVKLHMLQALAGDQVQFDYGFYLPAGEWMQRRALAVPERDAAGNIQGVLAILTDITAAQRTENQLVDSVREVKELKAALDAHAIVAITDARGVITQVNDKFCKISKYPRNELLGKTHQIINSGHHPKGFFKDLWATITRGEVWSGEICNRAKDGSLYWVYTTIMPFVGSDGVPVQYIAIRADITKRKQAEQEAQRMAFHDALTGLPNRRLMSERVRQALARVQRDKHYGALMLMDLDHFKEINDTLGHAQGDELLRKVADRLRQSVRHCDTVARLGGDEFVVVLDDLGAQLDMATSRAGDLGEKIRLTLDQPYDLQGQRVVSSSSIGVVMFSSAEDDPEEMLKQADLALYKAKEAGRNSLRFFDPSLQADVNNRANLLRDLRLSIEAQQLQLHYQPVVNSERLVLGVEALLRWKHPERGMVPPTTFISLAEQTNLILPIGKWVLDTACAQLHAWADDPIRSAWSVAVNVSARQFYEAGFVASVQRALATAGADPSRLRIELTESLLQSDLEGTITKMHTLGRLGVRFSLDDFGTGYSSLSYLKRLPLDQFKIDKSFVSDILADANDAAIARTILALASSLGLSVVAEGVESEAQFECLKGMGCDNFQGYLFSRPMPAQALPSSALL